MAGDGNAKLKGALLERIIEQLCASISNARVTRNVKLVGKKSDSPREVDVWIEGRYHVFPVTIAIESRNYVDPIGIEMVESFRAKLEDIGADLGVMVCPAGFTKPAKERAQFDRIQLYEMYDPQLGNSDLFIPIRYIEPGIRRFGFTLHGRAKDRMFIPSDQSRWRFKVDGQVFDREQLVIHAWNTGKVPQEAGWRVADFGAVIMLDAEDPQYFEYCEVEVLIEVGESYYLKLLPASFLRGAIDGRDNFNVKLDFWSTEEQMLKNGWRRFETLDQMNRAADIENQPESIQRLIIRPNYTVDVNRPRPGE